MGKDTTTLDIEQIRMSFSAVDTWLTCGKRYEFRYIEKVIEPPAIALIEGSSHHKALEFNNHHKKRYSVDLNPRALTDTFMDNFRERTDKKNLKGRLDWEGHTENSIFKRAQILHEDYIGKFAPKIHPVEIEEKFVKEVEVDGIKFTLSGIQDVMEKKRIIDYKTTSKSKSQGETDSNLQLSLYSWAGKKTDVSIIQFVKTLNPYVGIINSTRNGQQQIWALKVAAAVAKAIQAGHFPMCSPTSWACSERFCGYWKFCRGRWQ